MYVRSGQVSARNRKIKIGFKARQPVLYPRELPPIFICGLPVELIMDTIYIIMKKVKPISFFF